MATLKGAYQRFVTSIIRLWKGEEQGDSDETEQQTTSQEFTNDITNVDNSPESTSSVFEYSGVDLEASPLTPREVTPPPYLRPQSKKSRNRSNSNLDVPTLQLRPASLIVQNRSSPNLSDAAKSDLYEHNDKLPPLSNLGSIRRFPVKVQLRRDKSTSNLLRSPSRLLQRPSRQQRPKSVSDFLEPEPRTEKQKLKKSPTFLKLSPSVFRKPVVKNRSEPANFDRETPESPRIKTNSISAGFSRLSTISKRIDGTIRRRTKTNAKRKKAMEEIAIGKDKTMPVEPFVARLRDYNTYFEERPALQFKWKQDKTGNLLVDGMLNIYWGLKKSIRLQMADSSVKMRPQSQFAFGRSDDVTNTEDIPSPMNEENFDIVSHKKEKISGTLLRKKISRVAETMTNGEELGEEMPVINIENGILGETRHRSYDRRRMALRLKNGGERVKVDVEDSSPEGHIRQKSVILRKRLTNKSGRKRFSINGHAYNYQTSVFTPAYESVTNVRVTSKSSCDDVIKHLLSKFRVENSAEEFSLFVVKETEERRELSRSEYPLVTRILSGPNEQLCKIFLMERHVHGDISSDVAQYIKLDLNILQMFIKKFSEEEERETKKMSERYEMYRKMLEKRIEESSES